MKKRILAGLGLILPLSACGTWEGSSITTPIDQRNEPTASASIHWDQRELTIFMYCLKDDGSFGSTNEVIRRTTNSEVNAAIIGYPEQAGVLGAVVLTISSEDQLHTVYTSSDSLEFTQPNLIINEINHGEFKVSDIEIDGSTQVRGTIIVNKRESICISK